jgi:hypothetical protein
MIPEEISSYALVLTWAAQTARAAGEQEAAKARGDISRENFIPALEHLANVRDGLTSSAPTRGKGKAKASARVKVEEQQ